MIKKESDAMYALINVIINVKNAIFMYVENILQKNILVINAFKIIQINQNTFQPVNQKLITRRRYISFTN